MNSGDKKSNKRRRSDEFDYLQRGEINSKDSSKDVFARVQRTDPNSKDGEFAVWPQFVIDTNS